MYILLLPNFEILWWYFVGLYILSRFKKWLLSLALQLIYLPWTRHIPYMHHNFHTLCDYFIILGRIIFSLGKAKQCINKAWSDGSPRSRLMMFVKIGFPASQEPLLVEPSGAPIIKYTHKWAVTWNFQQCGMCDQQRLRPAGAYAQTDQSLC